MLPLLVPHISATLQYDLCTSLTSLHNPCLPSKPPSLNILKTLRAAKAGHVNVSLRISNAHTEVVCPGGCGRSGRKGSHNRQPIPH